MVGDRAEVIEGKHDDFPLYNEDLRESGPSQSILTLAEQIRSADGVLFFSPEYNYSVPGVLKNTIDWMSKLPDQPFAGKPAAIISASIGTIGGTRMQYHLRQICVFLDVRFLNKPEVMIGEVQKKVDASGHLTDDAMQKFLQRHFEQFTKFVRREI